MVAKGYYIYEGYNVVKVVAANISIAHITSKGADEKVKGSCGCALTLFS